MSALAFPAPDRERHGFLRAAVASPALLLGDVRGNAAAIESEARCLSQLGCRLVVFPELCLTGYSCGDLFHTQSLLQQVKAALPALAKALEKVPAIITVGLPWQVEGRLYNMAAVLVGGKIVAWIPKTYLPTSGEFYERRWFSPAETLNATELDGVPCGTDLLIEATDLPGLVLGVEICEDLWTVMPPSGYSALAGATVLANLSASNELLGKADYRRQLVCQQSARCLAAYLYAGAGPGESSTDLVFSGHSLIAENGSLLAQSARFRFDHQSAVTDVDLQRLQHERLKSTCFRDEKPNKVFRTVPIELGPLTDESSAPQALLRSLVTHPFVPSAQADRKSVCEEIFAIQATGLARRLRQVRCKRAVLGLSGGLDSTLALLVLIEALKRAEMPREAALVITMPGFGTTKRTRGNAEKLAEAMGIEMRTIPIHAAVEQHFKDIGHSPDLHDVTYENAQARERTQILMDVANQTQGLVVGTGDLSEAALGWCTFNGDHMSMYHVNAGVPKTLVRYLIEWAASELHADEAGNILQDIVATPISPELLPTGKDGSLQQRTEDTVGPYELHDFFLYHWVRHGCSLEKIQFLAQQAFATQYTEGEVQKWLQIFAKRFIQSQFKRSAMPDGPKVGTVALSPRGDWRMPSDWAGPSDRL